MDHAIISGCNWDPWQFAAVRLLLYLSIAGFAIGLFRITPALLATLSSRHYAWHLEVRKGFHTLLLLSMVLLQILAILYWRYGKLPAEPVLMSGAEKQLVATDIALFNNIEGLRFSTLYFSAFTFSLLSVLIWLIKPSRKAE
jgi:hypothetical protein